MFAAYTAPASSSITLPQGAELIAAWILSPGATRITFDEVSANVPMVAAAANPIPAKDKLRVVVVINSFTYLMGPDAANRPLVVKP